MTQPFTPPDPVSLVMYEEALTQPGLYLHDDLVPEWALLERHIQQEKSYAVFLMCEYTASRPMGMIPFERLWEDTDERGARGLFGLDDIDASSGGFCVGHFNHYAGLIPVADALHSKDTYVGQMKASVIHRYPQLLSITLTGIFAQTFPIPVPPRPAEEHW